ncbi:hypothetical protein [Bacillus pinisoli]|uniref:hypothetical protein n=1 Tax=Bacillus pinisoli TaxID=2901866 RepID=UPI001FF24203|nr:hypothetical protein [Bacillus pinisoli]
MSIIFTTLHKEVLPRVRYEGEEDYLGLIFYNAKEKSIINMNDEQLYIDLISFAHENGLSEKGLLEIMSYNAGIKSYLAYYRDKNLRVVRLLEIRGLDDLSKLLRSVGTDNKKLKETKEKVFKMIQKIEEKEEQVHGKNQAN